MRGEVFDCFVQYIIGGRTLRRIYVVIFIVALRADNIPLQIYPYPFLN